MEKLVDEKDYTLINGVLTINEGIKYIPESQFVRYENIKKVVLPSTLISIGFKAFFECMNLEEVFISDSVKYIHTFSFSGCKISKLTLGKNVYYIGYEAFSYNNLFEVKNNSTELRMISPFAFGFNKTLIKFNMKSDAYAYPTIFSGSINEYDLISNSRFKKIDKCNVCGYSDSDKYTYENGKLIINEGVEIIGDFTALKECESVEMPDSVIMIRDDAFLGLSKLEHVKFSKNLFYILYSSFKCCSLRKNEVVLPESLCEIKEYAFDGNYGENNVIIPLSTCLWRIMRPSKYDRYEFRDYGEINENPKYIFNVNELLKEERKLLESLSLLPENININSELNNKLDSFQSNAFKKLLIDFLNYDNYDEAENIGYVIKLLELKEINVSDIHETINKLFLRKQIKTIYLLMSYGYDFYNNSIIARAIINNMHDMLEVLFVLGVNINEIGSIDMTPLSVACQTGNIDLVKTLIDKGAAINKVDSRNKKAIDYAEENKYQNIVELINSFDTDKSELDNDLETITRQLRMEGSI